ncbi:MAG: tRNA pseudouridine(55) synthase TruB [Candidatus Hydrogenedentes bacterium]|nr:tRNA pseudouridine(55) synthase TruB [Candidatus Hydrogenedentota bacterium]
MTSHDVVDHVRRAARTRRVGHTGTLDPGATGLLILCVGTATRLSEHLTGLDKTYEGTMRLGVTTDSFDMDGQVLEERPVPELALRGIQEKCDAFVGDILQIPPMISAVKVGGERLYKMARKGEVVEREPRPVTVYEFSVQSVTLPDVEVRVRCSRGTYVRSLCHDVGQALGCGAILASLRRTEVGRFQVKDAAPLTALSDVASVEERLLSMDEALDLPQVIVNRLGRDAVRSGGKLTVAELRGQCPVREGWVQVKSEQGELLALATVERSALGVLVQPRRVFTQ